MINIKKFLKDTFLVDPNEHYDFSLSSNEVSIDDSNKKIEDVKNIFPSIDVNLEYVKVKYNAMISNDVIIREFNLTARNRQYKAFLLFIDGLVNTDLINNYVLKPLMMKNQANSFDSDQTHVLSEAVTNNITVRKVKKFDIVNYISNCLLPQNSIEKQSEFSSIFAGVNARKLCFIY